VVEIKGRNDLVTACSTKAVEGMEILTESEKIKRARKINLELIFAQHREECNDCVWKYDCQLLKLAEKYEVKINRFKDRKSDFPRYIFGKTIDFDSSKCIDCRNCVETCHKQGVDFLELEESGNLTKVVPSNNPKRDCVYCGQCIAHCPVGAFEGVGEFEGIEKPLMDKEKIVVAQFAPSIRTSLGEEFDLMPGEVVTGKIVAALRKLGFNYVFDTSVGADFTTTEESKEIVERIKENKTLPIMTSCCPSWVKFIEFYFPEFIPNLTTAKSPQIMLGGLIKTYWAKEMKIDPKNIVVVSIMPCVSKKYEINREELKSLSPVDFVLTTRELARLIMKNKIDFKNLPDEDLDSAFGEPSGAGVIYGASGGVMESAFRTTYEKLLDGMGGHIGPPLQIDFTMVRGMEGVKKAEVKIGDEIKKIAVINGLGNAKKFLEELKNDNYTCVEVMACPGGCIGGGGQPLPSFPYHRQKRAEGLYNIDRKSSNRKGHENPIVKKIYSEFLDKDEKLAHAILHTSYKKKGKEGLDRRS
jgi:iron-only hydrogenase group A